MAHTVNIGINSAKDFYRQIATPNFREFARKDDLVTAINTAYAMWHLAEWIFYELKVYTPHKRNDREKYLYGDLRKLCPDIVVMQDLAETGKHRKLRRDDMMVKRTEEEEHSFFLLAGPSKEYFVVYENKREPLRDVFSRVNYYWQSELEKLP